MSFGFSAPCPYLPDNIEFCFHLNPIFQLSPSKSSAKKKIKTLNKKIADNSEALLQRKREIV